MNTLRLIAVVAILSFSTRSSSQTIVLSKPDYKPHCIAFSPDGNSLAVGSEHGVDVWDLLKSKVSIRLDTRETVFSVAYSPDGKSVAGGTGALQFPQQAGRCTVYLWRLDDGAAATRDEFEKEGLIDVEFIDGKRLVVGGQSGKVLSVPTLRREGVLPDLSAPFAIASNGAHIIARSTRRSIAVVELMTSGLVGRVKGDIEYSWLKPRCLAAAGNARLLAYAVGREIAIFDIAAEKELDRIVLTEKDISVLAMSPNGRQLAYGSTSGEFGIWDIVTKETILSKRSGLPLILDVSMSPDSSRLAIVGAAYFSAHPNEFHGTVQVWEVGGSPSRK